MTRLVSISTKAHLCDSLALIQISSILDQYQSDWRLIQDLGSHFVCHVGIARDADIRDETFERSSLQCRDCLWFRRSDRSFHSTRMPFTQNSTEPPQLLDVLVVDGQPMYGRVLIRALGKCPSLQGFRARVEDFLDIRARQVGSEGYIKREINHDIRRREGRNWLAVQRRPLDGLSNRQIHLIRPRGHQAGRCHLLEAMTSLASNIAGEPLHLPAPRPQPRLLHFPYRCHGLGVKVGKGASGSS